MHFFFLFNISGFSASRHSGALPPGANSKYPITQEAVLPSEFLSLLTNCRVKSLIWRLLVK